MSKKDQKIHETNCHKIYSPNLSNKHTFRNRDSSKGLRGNSSNRDSLVMSGSVTPFGNNGTVTKTHSTITTPRKSDSKEMEDKPYKFNVQPEKPTHYQIDISRLTDMSNNSKHKSCKSSQRNSNTSKEAELLQTPCKGSDLSSHKENIKSERNKNSGKLQQF